MNKNCFVRINELYRYATISYTCPKKYIKSENKYGYSFKNFLIILSHHRRINKCILIRK